MKNSIKILFMMAFFISSSNIFAQDAEPLEKESPSERKFDINSDEDFQEGFVMALMHIEQNKLVRDKRQIIKSDPETYKEYKDYYSNGRLKIVAYQNLITGKWDGDYIEYYDNGKPKLEGFVIDGNWAGIVNGYYPNGKIYYSGHYYSGKKFGRWEYFDENGKIEELQMYDPNGNLISSVKINADGFYEGEKKVYEDGRLETIEHYKNGKKIN